jgi:cation diffusion facilitator CzcD-associated flavoprotein CzcO
MIEGTQEFSLKAVTQWLEAFETALSKADLTGAGVLFHKDSYWRDLLAFTWRIQTVRGGDNIVAALKTHGGNGHARHFQIDPGRTAPRIVTRAGIEAIEAIFAFETTTGPANGVLRLTSDEGEGHGLKAWTLMTALDELRGFEETVGNARPTGEVWSRDFRGPNWLDGRQAAIAYADRDPDVLVVGGGQAGLSIAAHLTQLKIDTLIVDREQRIGDNWRNRYHALVLHNQVHVNHLPYMPFPPNWPSYIPKDKIAGWFESYAENMELNYWTGAEFSGATWDADTARWSVSLNLPDRKSRQMHPRHIVMATGVSGIPSLPDISGLENFSGRIMHSSEYDEGSDWTDRNVLIVGTGNSAHDIAQDLHAHNAHVTMVQRSPTMILNVEPSAQLPYALYSEGPPLEDCDLTTASMPFQVMRKSHQLMTGQIRSLDKDLLDDLARVGFKTDFGWDESGWQFKYLERGGGYYFNVGCSDLIINGEIGLVQLSDLDTLVADGARMVSGDTMAADLIVLATGYQGQEILVRELFDEAVADRVGPIWGFDDEQHELRNMFVRTGQPGLWFIAGSFAQCRIYSKYLGLQIKACEEGLIPLV